MGLHCPGHCQCGGHPVAGGGAEYVHPIAGDPQPGGGTGHHPLRHGYPDLAGGLCAAQRSARRQRRKVYDGRIGGLDARLAFGVQLDFVRQHGLGRRRRLVGHGH